MTFKIIDECSLFPVLIYSKENYTNCVSMSYILEDKEHRFQMLINNCKCRDVIVYAVKHAYNLPPTNTWEELDCIVTYILSLYAT